MKRDESISVDFAVVGCGVAGLRAAIELGQAGRVLVLAKSALTDTATEHAQGGIAVALSDEDEISLHAQDTLAAGDGLCNPEGVRILVEEGPRYILELIEWGTRFDRAGTKLAFTREGAHSRSRVLHAHGDSTGREISRALLARAQSIKGIEFRAHAFTTGLLLDDGRVGGLRFFDTQHHRFCEVHARGVLLATGGLGQVYRETTNPEVATGDGVVIAYEAGAELSDLEFVQFHPTALCVKGAPRFLLSEALRGEGGVLRNAHLERFMRRHHEALELAPRDVVARAILAEMHRTDAEFIYLDMTGLKADCVRERFPRIYQTCLSYGLDITSDLMPVRPAAHYAMGGVRTNLWGETTLRGLFAAGEAAATGVHGANRLASNSLLEGLVYGARAGARLAERAAHSGRAANRGKAVAASNAPHDATPDNAGHPKHSNPDHNPAGHPALAAAREQIRIILWNQVGIIRNGRDIRLAIEQLGALGVAQPAAPDPRAWEVHNLSTIAELISRSALARQESRGSHYRSDFPYRNDDDFQKHSVIRRGGKVTFE